MAETLEVAQSVFKLDEFAQAILGNDKDGKPLPVGAKVPQAIPAINVLDKPVEVTEPVSATPVKTAEEIAAEEEEKENDKFVKRHNKIHGTEFTSLKEIEDAAKPKRVPTAEEILAQETKEKNEAFEFALDNKLFTREDYDKSVIAKSKDKTAIALELFTAEYLAENPTAKADEAEEKFKDFYALDESDTSWKKKQGLKEIGKIADNYLKQFEPIDKHVDKYKEVVTLNQKAKEFNKQIKAVAESLPKEITVEIPLEGIKDGKAHTEKVPYKFQVTEDMLKSITKTLTDNNSGFYHFNASTEQVKDDKIKATIISALKSQSFDTAIASAVNEHVKLTRLAIKAKHDNSPERTLQPTMFNNQPKVGGFNLTPEAKQILGQI